MRFIPVARQTFFQEEVQSQAVQVILQKVISGQDGID